MPGQEKVRTLFFLGGSSEIALATLPLFDQPGTALIVQHRSASTRLDDVAASLRNAQLIKVQADVSTEAGTLAMCDRVDQALASVGSVALDGILIAASPAVELERFRNKTWAAFAAQLEVQVRAPMQVLARALPQMAKRKSGRVVFVLSSYTLGNPPSGLADYVTAKHAQLGLMRALAAEYASKNLQINAVSPSMVETKFLHGVPRLVVEMNAEKHPLQRNATPSDVAPAIHFLLADGASYINGANLAITGGAAS